MKKIPPKSKEKFESKTIKFSTEELGNREIAAVWALRMLASRA